MNKKELLFIAHDPDFVIDFEPTKKFSNWEHIEIYRTTKKTVIWGRRKQK